MALSMAPASPMGIVSLHTRTVLVHTGNTPQLFTDPAVRPETMYLRNT